MVRPEKKTWTHRKPSFVRSALGSKWSTRSNSEERILGPRNSLCLAFFLYFEGRGGPEHKEFVGSGVPWRGGLRGGVSGEILSVCAFFSGPDRVFIVDVGFPSLNPYRLWCPVLVSWTWESRCRNWYSAKRAGVKGACPNKVMAHMWFMHDAHSVRAFLFFEILAEYTGRPIFMGPEMYPVLGLGSGERLLWHFQNPVLYWINFSLRYTLLSMTVMVTPCLWYVVGMKLVMSYVKFPSKPLLHAPLLVNANKSHTARIWPGDVSGNGQRWTEFRGTLRWATVSDFSSRPACEMCHPCPHGDPQTSPQHADPHGFLVWFS